MTATRSAIRVFCYTLLGSILSSGVLTAIQVDGVLDVSVLSKAGVSALVAGVTAVITFAYNYLEDSGVVASTKGK